MITPEKIPEKFLEKSVVERRYGDHAGLGNGDGNYGGTGFVRGQNNGVLTLI
jgi:hypothetical protein